MKNNLRLILLISISTILLLIPFIAMQFTSEVVWTLNDFFVVGVLLYSCSLLCELILRKVKKVTQRIVWCFFILLFVVLIWAELAVGVFGTPFAGS